VKLKCAELCSGGYCKELWLRTRSRNLMSSYSESEVIGGVMNPCTWGWLDQHQDI
jgi:hypothetical protein